MAFSKQARLTCYQTEPADRVPAGHKSTCSRHARSAAHSTTSECSKRHPPEPADDVFPHHDGRAVGLRDLRQLPAQQAAGRVEGPAPQLCRWTRQFRTHSEHWESRHRVACASQAPLNPPATNNTALPSAASSSPAKRSRSCMPSSVATAAPRLCPVTTTFQPRSCSLLLRQRVHGWERVVFLEHVTSSLQRISGRAVMYLLQVASLPFIPLPHRSTVCARSSGNSISRSLRRLARRCGHGAVGGRSRQERSGAGRRRAST